MSKTMKWILIVFVLVVIALIVWWVAMYNTPNIAGPDDATATTNSANNTTGTSANTVSGNPVSLDQINRDVANMDIEFQAGMTGFANLGTAPSQVKIISVASHFKSASLLMTGLTVELGSAITNAKLTALEVPLTDIGTQLSNSTSQVEAILNNVSGVNPSATAGTSSILKQALAQLKLAQKSLQTARNDVTKIVNGLK
jgi:flagellar hook-basal body complex protein FliE